MNNFWESLGADIIALAPMAGITDSAFRQVCSEFGADVFYSEMASVDALYYSPDKTIEMLYYTKTEKPYVVQLFGSNWKYFEKAVKMLDKKIEPDGYDINFGCPVKKVLKQGAGAALMADLKKSKEVVQALVNSTGKPVSIKVRTKSGEVGLEGFLDNLSRLNISALMVHGRTLNQGFVGPIDFDVVSRVRKIFPKKLLVNGDINTQADFYSAIKKTSSDGAGLARGVLGRPWLIKEIKEKKDINKEKREVFKIALNHAKKAYQIKGEQAISEMRKHLSWYMHGLEGASELRKRAVEVKTISDIEELLS